MEQPPILGRPDSGLPATASVTPEPALAPADSHSIRGAVLATAGVAVAVLASCNGLLLWLYQHSSLGVVVTLGTFVAGVSLAWLRNRSRQITAIVLFIQALMVVSIAAGVLVGVNTSLWTGVLASGITLAGLIGLSLTGLLYYTGTRSRLARVVGLGTSLAVMAAMTGAYVFLPWDGHAMVTPAAPPKPPKRIVYYLIDKGQYYTREKETFNNYTCPTSRDHIAAIFAELVRDREQHLSPPKDLKIQRQYTEGETEVLTLTASISVIDESQSVIAGPQTWTFRLEKASGEASWRVCQIERPEGS